MLSPGPEIKNLKAVLDSNTVVSAILFAKGKLTWIRDLWIERRFTPLVSQATSRELIRVLAYPKFDLNEVEVQLLLATYLPYAEIITVGQRKSGRLPRCRDQDDQQFLSLAFWGKAEVLVTGDRALLELNGRTPFAIERPAEFRKRFFRAEQR